MARIIMLLCAMAVFTVAHAGTFSYRFNSTPLPKAIQRLMESHPDLEINFIYNEIENYTTSAAVDADDPYEALRQLIGLNPVTVVKSRGSYYLEALQHGKYVYTGRAVGNDSEPVAGATVMLLAPKDSTVLTYGIADEHGRFKIPCDRTDVIAKLSCIGYMTKYVKCTEFAIGTVVMDVNAVQLDAVTVDAALQHEYSDKSVFIPTARQKQNSDGAIDLLAQMAIPMLHINPQTGSVATNFKSSVAIYINYSKATEQDLDALNPADVKSVEYLVHPMDARFHHQSYVVNIILRKIEYGGYAKFRGNGNLMTGSANGLAYTKFSYRKMTYDLSVSDSNFDSHHGGSQGTQRFTLANGEQVERTTTQTNLHTQSNRLTAALRAKYEDDHKTISNRLTLSYSRQPNSYSEGEISFTPGLYSSDFYSSSLNRRTIYPTWSGEYYFDLGRNLSLSVNPNFHYYHVNSDSRYSSVGADIHTLARENVFEGGITAQIDKRLNERHGLNFNFSYLQNHDQVAYSGSSLSVQKFNDLAAIGLLTYQFNTSKLYAQFTIGGAYEWNHIDGQSTKDILPGGYFSVQYAIDSKKSLEFDVNYATNTTDISSKGGNIVQSNELLYLTGNPRLKNSRHISSDFSFNWAPCNEFSMSADCGYFEIFKRPTAIYRPYLDGRAVLRSMENDGNYAYEYAGLAFTSRLLGNSLILSFKPQIWLYQTTGEYDERRAAFLYNISAGYYFGKFYVSAYCNSGDDMLVQYSMNSNREKTRLTYGASIGWGNGKWTVRAAVQNPFRTSWRGDETWLAGKFFSSHQTGFSTIYHQSVQFTASYTFNYGKKLRPGDELTVGSDAHSAIMK